jgi:hypothetical protein
MIHDSASAPAMTGDLTTISPRDWFAGAGDDLDHAIRSWTPDESGYLNTVCGRPSAQAGRTTNESCPACRAATRALSARSRENASPASRSRTPSW